MTNRENDPLGYIINKYWRSKIDEILTGMYKDTKKTLMNIEANFIFYTLSKEMVS